MPFDITNPKCHSETRSNYVKTSNPVDLVAVEFYTPEAEFVELYDFRPDPTEQGVLARLQVHQLPQDYVSEYVRLPSGLLSATQSLEMETLEIRRNKLVTTGDLSLSVDLAQGGFLIRRYTAEHLARIANILD